MFIKYDACIKIFIQLQLIYFPSNEYLTSVDNVQQFHCYCYPKICMYTILYSN